MIVLKKESSIRFYHDPMARPLIADPEDLSIELPSGVRLEANFWRPKSSSENQGNKLAVCLHPWSWVGGRKDDP